MLIRTLELHTSFAITYNNINSYSTITLINAPQMNWLSQIFNTKTSTNTSTNNKYTSNYFVGKDAFVIGRKLFSESALEKPISVERRKQKLIAALEFFDKAIEKGYDEAEAFSFRGICLRDLNFNVDALNDFDKCIGKMPTKASFYYERALTKKFIWDFEGSIADFKKAIELSKIENEDTRYWNEYAKQTGYSSLTQKYEHDLDFILYDKKTMTERLRQDLYEIATLTTRNNL